MGRKKILIIDDDKETREMYADIFQKNGFAVIQAGDGLEGLGVAMKELPNIIFSGIIMPRMDGFSLMESLKKNVSTNAIPVVFSSHMGREEDRKKAEELGAKDFITRYTFTPLEVVEKIKTILNFGGYHIKIDSNDPEVKKMMEDIGPENFECPHCKGKMSILLMPVDIKRKSFSAKIDCQKCSQV